MTAPIETPSIIDTTGMFFTDPWLARKMVAWAGIGGLDVCEPSAGDGSIVGAILGFAGLLPKSVTAIEINTGFWKRIRKAKTDIPYQAFNEDFLQHKGKYDLCLGNPPYEEMADGKHVEHMLDISNRVVVLVRANFTFSKERYDLVFSRARITRRVVLKTRPKFHGPGDKGHTARHEYDILELVNHPGGMEVPYAVETEFWSGHQGRLKRAT